MLFGTISQINESFFTRNGLGGRLAFWLRFIHWTTEPAHLTAALVGSARKLVEFYYRITVLPYYQTGVVA
jgi:hypothetical protein